jgi:hypothetical protein
MRRALLLSVFLLAPAAAVIACSLTDLDSLSGGDVVGDSGGAGDAPPDGASASDGAAEGSDGATCVLPALPASPDLVTPAAAIDPRWILSGTASVASDHVVLTPDTDGVAGAIFWAAPFYFDKLEVSFEFVLQDPGSQIADGLTFVWSRGASVPSVGGESSGLGAAGLDGYAVALDTFKDTNDPVASAPFLAIVDTKKDDSEWFLTTVPVAVSTNARHQLRVTLDAPNVSVMLDGASRLTSPIPGYVPFKGYWGLTAATGGLSSAHHVANVVVTIPSGGGCVP